MDLALTRSPCHELHAGQHHSAQTHEDCDSRRNDDNSKAVNLLDDAIEPFYRYSYTLDVLLQTRSDALDVVPQTCLHSRNRITDRVGSRTPEWASQCTTKFVLGGQRASATGEVRECHREPAQANEE